MIKLPRLSSFVIDFTFLAVLVLLSISLIYFYFNANYLYPGYADWTVQAMRIKVLNLFGLTSWTHIWSNGISIWRSYQFIPHLLTLGVAKLFSLEITRAMVVMTIAQFIGLRLITYASLRYLQFNPLTSFVCALLTFDIGQYWSGVAEFSILFAFTFFPVMIVLWTKYHQGKLTYLYPYLCGICFYIHPLLGFSSMALFCLSNLFSSQKLLSLSLLTQMIIFLAASSLFWFPIVAKLSYYYTNPVFSTKYFLDLAISPYSYFGLSLYLLLGLGVSSIFVLKPIKVSWSWVKILYVFSVGYLALIIIGLKLNLPSTIYQFQYSRGATLIGIAIAFIFALVLEHLQTLKSTALKAVVFFILLLSLIEGMWFASIYSPQPLKSAEDVVKTAIDKKLITTEHRIWTPTIDWSSYLAPTNARFPYSYMEHMDSNQIPQRLTQLIYSHQYLDEASEVTINRLSYYFRITGTKYLIFDKGSPFASTYLRAGGDGYKNLGEISMKNGLYYVFDTPWETKDAVLIDKQFTSSLEHFPFNLRFNKVNDQIALDDYVQKYVDMLYSPENTALTITYPTQQTIEVGIPKERSSNLVYVNESSDIGWKAYFNNKEQKITTTGPNYMVITLDNLKESGTLILKHSWPLYFWIGLFLVFTIPLEILTLHIYRFTRVKRQIQK